MPTLIPFKSPENTLCSFSPRCQTLKLIEEQQAGADSLRSLEHSSNPLFARPDVLGEELRALELSLIHI